MDQVATDVAVISVAAFADVASTHYALKNCAQCYEFNPIMREPATSILLKSVGVATTVYAASYLRKRGHKKWAKFVRYTVFGLYMGLAVNNMRLGYEHSNDGANR